MLVPKVVLFSVPAGVSNDFTLNIPTFYSGCNHFFPKIAWDSRLILNEVFDTWHHRMTDRITIFESWIQKCTYQDFSSSVKLRKRWSRASINVYLNVYITSSPFKLSRIVSTQWIVSSENERKSGTSVKNVFCKLFLRFQASRVESIRCFSILSFNTLRCIYTTQSIK